MIWVTGGNGMLGKEISSVLTASGIDFIGTDIELDITSTEDVERFVSERKIDWIVNCAAYTAVDKAEDDAGNAFRVNTSALSNLVEAAEKSGAGIIHFSTDYVFDGKKRTPYIEDDKTSPSGVYGASKLAGEKLLLESYDKFFVFRISWLYGAGGKNFVNTMLNFFTTKDQLTVVNDQFGSPTYTGELASFIVQLIKDNSDKYGIYHFSGEGETTWYDFACEIFSLAKKYNLTSRDVKIKPVDSSSYPTKAKRPAYSYMSKEKLFKTFNYRPAYWKDSLEKYISSI